MDGKVNSPDRLLSGSEPLYKQVKEGIVRSLTTGEWGAGTVIPSEIRLAERYGVSTATIRAAIRELVAARVLMRRQGKGTFVSRHTDQRSIYQFFRVVRNDGLKEVPASRLLSLRRDKADDVTAEVLKLPRDRREAEVFRIKNVLMVSDRPVVASDITVPVSLLPGLTKAIIRNAGKTLYGLYQSKYGINIISTREELRAVKATAEISAKLRIPEGEALLRVDRVAYTFDNRPVEVRFSFVQTTDFHYLIVQREE